MYMCTYICIVLICKNICLEELISLWWMLMNYSPCIHFPFPPSPNFLRHVVRELTQYLVLGP